MHSMGLRHDGVFSQSEPQASYWEKVPESRGGKLFPSFSLNKLFLTSFIFSSFEILPSRRMRFVFLFLNILVAVVRTVSKIL